VTNALIAINVGIFVWELLMSFDTAGFNAELSELQFRMVISQQFIDAGEWYRLVSAGFVHFGFFHVAMNMFLLYQLGRLLEPAVGSLTFGLVYFASLLGGSAGALVVSPNALTGGASGAVFGLMAAGVVGLRQRGINPMQTGLGLTFIINLLFTLAIPGVSIGGHFGGALAGAVCGSVALAPARWRLPSWSANAVAIIVGMTAIAIAATPRL
jgi:membrane associated rhomboid family serine protease